MTEDHSNQEPLSPQHIHIRIKPDFQDQGSVSLPSASVRTRRWVQRTQARWILESAAERTGNDAQSD